MMYVLDTNVVSDLIRSRPAVLGNFHRVAASDVRVPQPVLGELAFGVARLPRSKRRATLEADLRLITKTIARAEWTDDVSDSFAEVKAALEKRGEIIEDFDIAIAAHALAVRATLVTANVKHMARIPGLRLADWSA